MGVLNPNAIEQQEFEATINTIDEDTRLYADVSDTIVIAYSRDLDELMARVQSECVLTEASDNVLEAYAMELSNALYFVGSRIESVGIKEDLTKIAAKETYNQAYLDGLATDGKKPTVAELSATAEDKAKFDTVLNSLYNRVYRQLKFKVDAAYEMLSTIRKVISKRMQEAQLNNSRNNGGMVFGKEEY